MKKISNRYRNNNNGVIYSLNYKFDSNSIAGKISGTALDLIKKYNDFAKDAQGNNDYVSAEIFRQYAEHYRKIVTEINERKSQRAAVAMEMADNSENMTEENAETEQNEEVVAEKTEAVENVSAEVKKEPKKSFKIIEISHVKADEAKSDNTADEVAKAETEVVKPKRVYRRRNTITVAAAETAIANS